MASHLWKILLTWSQFQGRSTPAQRTSYVEELILRQKKHIHHTQDCTANFRHDFCGGGVRRVGLDLFNSMTFSIPSLQGGLCKRGALAPMISWFHEGMCRTGAKETWSVSGSALLGFAKNLKRTERRASDEAMNNSQEVLVFMAFISSLYRRQSHKTPPCKATPPFTAPRDMKGSSEENLPCRFRPWRNSLRHAPTRLGLSRGNFGKKLASKAFPEFSPPQYGWGHLFFSEIASFLLTIEVFLLTVRLFYLMLGEP